MLEGVRDESPRRESVKKEPVWMFKNGWERRGSNFIGQVISTWDPGRI